MKAFLRLRQSVGCRSISYRLFVEINQAPTTTFRATASAASDTHPRSYFTDASQQDEPEIVLYQRKTNTSVTLMQSGFAFSSFHTAYWIWYTTDFIPVVNQAPMQDLHIDPTIGWAGILFAAALNFTFYLYPKRLVHTLSYRPHSQKIMVYTHRPPLMRPNVAFPAASFHIGKSRTSDSSTDDKPPNYLKLNPSSPEALMIVKQYGGDITRFRGHLKTGPRWPYYNLEILSAKDVPEPELLLEALLRPEYFSLENDDEILGMGDNNSSISPLRWNKAKRPKKSGGKKHGRKGRRRR